MKHSKKFAIVVGLSLAIVLIILGIIAYVFQTQTVSNQNKDHEMEKIEEAQQLIASTMQVSEEVEFVKVQGEWYYFSSQSLKNNEYYVVNLQESTVLIKLEQKSKNSSNSN